MNNNNLPEVIFVDADSAKVEAAVFSSYEEITGRTLQKGDPVRLFLLTIAAIIILLLNAINETGKQNLLRYAKGNNLDHLGALLGVSRIPKTSAKVTMEISLSAILGYNITIPAGTRFTADGKIFFALEDTLIIPAGYQTTTGIANCTVAGIDGNDYLPGQIKTLVDPIAYVASVVNITKSEGGAEIEDDESYREAIRLAPEGFSVAGPIDAYRYFAKRASASIVDVEPTSPSPGVVDVRILLKNGILPEEEMLRIVEDALHDKDIRPLTDNVCVAAPEVINYDINLKYFIYADDKAQETAIRNNVEKAISAFILWEKEKLGREVNPDELIRRIREAGAKRVDLTAPSYVSLNRTQVAIEGNVVVEYGGAENV